MTETDILKDPVTIKTYWEMKNTGQWLHNLTSLDQCSKCGKIIGNANCFIPDPIPLSVGDLVFFMANQCRKYSKELVKTLNQLWKKQSGSFPFSYWLIYIATPEQRIEAACAAWSTKDEED